MTVPQAMTPSSRGLGHRPFTAVTGVRIPLGSPNKKIHPKGCFFLFASIFVAADNALVIDRKMPFPDKGLFGVCAGGGRVPEKLLIGGGGRYCTAGVCAYLQSERCPRLLFFMGREVFGACQKKRLFRELFRTRRYGFLRQCADGYELKNGASAIKSSILR